MRCLAPACSVKGARIHLEPQATHLSKQSAQARKAEEVKGWKPARAETGRIAKARFTTAWPRSGTPLSLFKKVIHIITRDPPKVDYLLSLLRRRFQHSSASWE